MRTLICMHKEDWMCENCCKCSTCCECDINVLDDGLVHINSKRAHFAWKSRLLAGQRTEQAKLE